MNTIPLHRIAYIPLLGSRQSSPIPLVPSPSLTDTMLSVVGLYPTSLEHLVLGYDFYASTVMCGTKDGYMLIPVYADDLDVFKQKEEKLLRNATIVYLVCTEEQVSLNKINSFLHEVEGENCIVLAYEILMIWGELI